MSAKFTAAEVFRYFGIKLASLPKLAKTHILKDALETRRSAYRALFSFFHQSVFADVEDELKGIATTPAAASIGAVIGCQKDATSKLALYILVCSLGISDHPESVRKTIIGNADKWTRKDAFERYPSDLAYVEIFSQKKFKDFLTKRYDAILQQLRDHQRAAAATAAKKAS